jgi:hypothetical protein
MKTEKLQQLPGAELVLRGIADLIQNEETEYSLLVRIGSSRLRAAGLKVPTQPELHELPEHLLYRRLSQVYNNEAHSRYNAMIRRLVSFERALELLRLEATPHQR